MRVFFFYKKEGEKAQELKNMLVSPSPAVSVLALLLLTGASSATVNFYTGTVNTLFYESLVSGNSVLDVI